MPSFRVATAASRFACVMPDTSYTGGPDDTFGVKLPTGAGVEVIGFLTQDAVAAGDAADVETRPGVMVWAIASAAISNWDDCDVADTSGRLRTITGTGTKFVAAKALGAPSAADEFFRALTVLQQRDFS